MERLAEAQKASEELKVMIEQGMNKNRMRRYYLLMGRIEIEKEDYSKAIEYFKKGLPLLFQTSNMPQIYADSLGLAYYMSGNLEKAREEYERIDSLYTGRLNFGDEQQGNKPKAIENYEKFLELWKDADPSISEVEDARKRLAELKNQ
jgi:tetratricopeptide (TPR) repeat protein